MSKDKPEQLVQSIDRALNILERLVESDSSMGVTDLSNSLGLHKSTVYRLLTTLVYRGFVEQDENNRYNVGLKLFELGGIVLNKMRLRKKVKPYMSKLQNECKETVHLGILDDLEVVYIDKEETRETIRMYSEVGRRVAAYCTSLGKVLLAYSDIDIAKEFANYNFEKYTANSIDSLALLQEHLKQVKEQGYAIDNQEQELGIRCIGAPIFNYDNQVIAAFSVAGPTSRMSEGKVDQLKTKVLKYSKEISAFFGYKV
ncbi:IclR family transcriptional regulator [Natronospora cellulosivora (SeqCode)]